jgi:hypothetical protein
MNFLTDIAGALLMASIEGRSSLWWIPPLIWAALFGVMSILAATASNLILAVILMAIAASLPVLRLWKLAQLSRHSDRKPKPRALS